jgi:hypothetical protein
MLRMFKIQLQVKKEKEVKLNIGKLDLATQNSIKKKRKVFMSSKAAWVYHLLG